MLKYLFLCLLTTPAFAGGAIPAVNSDMGCTASGHSVYYNGTSLICGVSLEPTSTVAALPSCNSSIEGATYVVTNALTPALSVAVVDGGAVHVQVICLSSVWKVAGL